MGDITNRSDFDLAVADRFPKARRHRKETENGWADTFRIGLLEIRIRVYGRVKNSTPWGAEPGRILIEILGVREAIDGSSTVLWQTKGKGWTEACRALDNLREELLGTAHGLYRVCKRIVKNPIHLETIEERYTDIDQVIDSLLK